MLPETFAPVMAAFGACFSAPTYQTFRCLVAGWVQCHGRHTVTAVAMAAGVVGWCHISVFHRFFSRARWEVDAVGKVAFRLALQWVPAGQAVVLLGDDTLARKRGKAIALGSMHHDPLLSRVRKAFCSFGHVWVVLALWVPLPFGPHGAPKGIAVPVLFRLYVGRRRGNGADAAGSGTGATARSRRATSGPRFARAQATFPPAEQRPTKTQLAREGIALVAQWLQETAPGRTMYFVGDTAYTNRTTLEERPANVEVVGRLRPDAALWTLPPPRRPGQKGRSRRRGTRLPTPQHLAAGRTTRGTWHRMPVTLYGKRVTPLVFRGTALWYGALRDAPIRFVVVRDPSGRRHDEAFFCTDRTVGVRFLLETYAKRWSIEVTFHDAKQHLGLADAQVQSAPAVRRTAPFAGFVYALVVLWAAQRLTAGARVPWPQRPWYRHKATLSLQDLLDALRRAALAERLRHPRPRSVLSAPSCPPRRPQNARTRHPTRTCLAA